MVVLLFTLQYYASEISVEIQDIDLNNITVKQLSVKDENNLFASPWSGKQDENIYFNTNKGDLYAMKNDILSLIADNVKKHYYDFLYLKNDGDLYYKKRLIASNVKDVEYTDWSSFKKDIFYIKNNGKLYRTNGKKDDKHEFLKSKVKKVWLRYTLLEDVYGSQGNAIFILTKNDTLWAMGNNKVKNLGCGNKNKVKKPVKVLEDVENIYFEENTLTVYAMKKDKSLWVWGDPDYSGLKVYKPILKPKKILSGVKYFDSAIFGAIKKNGDFYSWNWDLGVRIKHDGVVKKKISTKVKEIGGKHFVKEDGSLWTWGSYSGNGYKKKSQKPTMILAGIKKIAYGLSSNCDFTAKRLIALNENGDLYYWGLEDCFGSKKNILTPKVVATDIKDINTQYYLCSDGKLFNWCNYDDIKSPILVDEDVQDIRGIVDEDGDCYNYVYMTKEKVCLRRYDDNEFTKTVIS